MYKVLVVCLENWDTLQEVPFVLSKAGYTVDVLCHKDSWLLKNKFYHKWIERKDDIQEFQQQLFELATDTKQAYNWIVLGDEKLLKLMNDNIHSEELFYKILPLSKIENRELLGSKEGISNLCIKYSIQTPKFIVYTHEAGFDVNNISLKYPVLLKQDLSWGGGGIASCNNKTELEEAIKKTSKEFHYVIQEYIKGDDIGVEAFYNRGELLNYNAARVISYADSPFAFTTKRNYFLNDKLKRELEKLGTDFGINGFASIQVIYKKDEDAYYFLEADLRPNIWIPYGRFTGQDFSEAIAKKINQDHQIKPNTILHEGEQMEVAVFYRDMIRCFRQREIKGILQWIFNYKGYWKFIPIYDGVLFKNILFELFVKKTVAGFRKMLSNKKQ